MPPAAPNNLTEARPDTRQLDQITLLTKALADKTRLRILGVLKNRELCACQIIELFDLADSTISKHLAILRQAGLIQARKEGRWIYFSRVAESNPDILATFTYLDTLLKTNTTIQQDRARVAAILKIDPVELYHHRQSSKNYCP